MRLRTLSNATNMALVLSSGIVLYLAYLLRDYVIDDAYITFRHARNLLNGAGFAFNPGDRLLSTTAPLHGLILAALGFVFGLTDFARAAIVLSTLSLLALCVITSKIMSQNGATLAGIAAVLLIAAQHWFYRFFPLETVLVLALNLASIALALNRRWILAGIVSGLAIVARPDSVVLLAVIALYTIIKSRRFNTATLRYVASCLAVASIWYGLAWYYYGTPLPNTLAAKSGFASGWLVYAAGLWPNLLSILFGDHVIVSAAAVALAVVGSIWALIDRSDLLVLPAWALAHILGYSALRISFPYAWYYAPVIFAILVLACLGTVRTFQWLMPILSKWLPDGWRASGLVVSWVCLAVGFLVVLQFSFSAAWEFAHSYRTNYYSGVRDDAYRLVGDWLRLHTAPTDRVAVGEIGTIGWYSDRTIVDFYGLATYELRNLRKTGDWIGAIEQIEPEYVVTVRTQPPDPQMTGLGLSNYVEVMSFPKDDIENSYEDIVVYRRVP